MRQDIYVDRLSTPIDFKSTAVTKETYLDAMEVAFGAYTVDQIMNRKQITGAYLDLQSYSRLTCVLSCLIAGGRMQEQFELWERMLTECCREIHTIYDGCRSHEEMRDKIMADFSIKEIMFSIKLMNRLIPDAKRKEWYSELRKIEREKNFHCVIRKPEDEPYLHNINIYNMVGEYLRETEGLTETAAYFSTHWPLQLTKFDNNGMYQDPGCPMLYDLTTRCQIQIMMGNGYRGDFALEIDEHLRKAGYMTLLMQSAAYEFPYGGRSNQFLFNEALIASNCEYEAVRYKAEGNMQLAGAFKRSAHLAIQSINRWLNAAPPRHIKNFYPIHSQFGTEVYAYYDKYMITMGAFLAIGYFFADDSIKEAPCPAELGGYVLETSEAFHKIFANAGGYSLEIDTKANLAYDATGLGRIHRAGVPTELALSSPLSNGHSFKLPDTVQRMSSGISPGWKKVDGSLQFLSELSDGLSHKLTILEESPDEVAFTVKYTGECINGCGAILESYVLNQDGLRYWIELANPAHDSVYLRVPLLISNGESQTQWEQNVDEITVKLDEFSYTIGFEGQAKVSDEIPYGNRNGQYGLAIIQSTAARISASFALR